MEIIEIVEMLDLILKAFEENEETPDILYDINNNLITTIEQLQAIDLSIKYILAVIIVIIGFYIGKKFITSIF